MVGLKCSYSPILCLLSCLPLSSLFGKQCRLCAAHVRWSISSLLQSPEAELKEAAVTWVTSASHAETSSVARWLLSRDLSGLCPWASCVFPFHTSSFSQTLLYIPAGSIFIFGGSDPQASGASGNTFWAHNTCTQCAGPSDGPDGTIVCTCVNRAAGMRVMQQLAGP